MTTPTKLVIQFDRRTLDGGASGYYMHTKVISAEPITLEKCLIYSTVTGEKLVRIANLQELGLLPPPPAEIVEAPTEFFTFSAASLSGSGVIPTDFIRVLNGAAPNEAPRLWREMGYSSPYVDYAVLSVVGTTVTVAASFPAYAEDIHFEVRKANGSLRWNTGTTDGVATRDYGGVPVANYRVSERYDLFTDLTEAQDTYDVLVGDAQALVDSYNEDRWGVGTETEVFE